MRLTVLTDNTTRIDAYYLGEPGVSYYIQDSGKNMLFDTGYSDVFIRNAAAMKLDYQQLDAIVFSHGHNDHTGGLAALPESIRDIPIYAHPAAFLPKRSDGEDIGSPITTEELAARFELRLSSMPVPLTDRLLFLGEIPRTNDFENKTPIGEKLAGGLWEPDYVLEDSALVYRGDEGLTIITGCSHAGICNITEYAKAVCGDDRIAGIIGGFHLLEMTSQVEKTAEYLRIQHPGLLCPCHCTCFHARAAIDRVVPIRELCVGDVLEIS